MSVSIYELFDPRFPDQAVYVGKSRRPQARYRTHLKSPCNEGLRRLNEELNQLGLQLGFRVVESCDEANWEDREKFWIARWRERNPFLLNVLDGGNQFPDDVSIRAGRLGGARGKGKTPWNKGLKGAQKAWNKGLSFQGRRLTEEEKRKISEAKKGRPNIGLRLFHARRRAEIAKLETPHQFSVEEIALASALKLSSLELNKRRGESQRGKSISEETRRKLSVALSGKVYGDAHWTRRSPEKLKPLRGKDHPMFGKSYSAEERAAQSAKLKGRPQSEETRARMKAAQSNPVQRAINSRLVTEALNDPEVRERISKGVKAALTPEVLEKRRESQRRVARTPEGIVRSRRANLAANHNRHHVRRGIVNLECSLCFPISFIDCWESQHLLAPAA